MSYQPHERLAGAVRRLRSAFALQGVVVALIVAVPPLVIEEDWHGRPMIDQPGHLWVIPALVAAAGLILGGAVGARRARRPARAVLVGALVGAVAAAVLIVADVLRRTARQQALPLPVLRLWIEAALVSVALAALGAAARHLTASSER